MSELLPSEALFTVQTGRRKWRSPVRRFIALDFNMAVGHPHFLNTRFLPPVQPTTILLEARDAKLANVLDVVHADLRMLTRAGF